MFGLRFFWRPGVERGPGVAASLKCCGFLYRQSAFVVQPVGKPRRFDFLAEVNGGIAVKRNVAQRRAFAAAPAAMIPRTYHQKVVIFLIGFFQAGLSHLLDEEGLLV